MIPTNCCYHPSKGPGVFFKNAYCRMIGATYLIGTIAFGTFEAYIPTYTEKRFQLYSVDTAQRSAMTVLLPYIVLFITGFALGAWFGTSVITPRMGVKKAIHLHFIINI